MDSFNDRVSLEELVASCDNHQSNMTMHTLQTNPRAGGDTPIGTTHCSNQNIGHADVTIDKNPGEILNNFCSIFYS